MLDGSSSNLSCALRELLQGRVIWMDFGKGPLVKLSAVVGLVVDIVWSHEFVQPRSKAHSLGR